MEIDLIFILNWHKKVWCPPLFLLIMVTMATVAAVSSDASSHSVAMETNITSYSDAHSPGATSLPSSSPSDDPIYPTPDDDKWWEGVEEIDLTLPFDLESEKQEHLKKEESKDEEGTSDEGIAGIIESLSNDTTFWDMDCEIFFQMTPPPLWGNLPPPPLLPILRDIAPLLQEFGQKQISRRQKLSSTSSEKEAPTPEGVDAAGDEDLSPFPPLREDGGLLSLSEDDHRCSLCEWAEGGNHTLNLFAKRQIENSGVISSTMVGALVGVAFVSAALGAALMSFLLKCRRGVVAHPCGGGPCLVFVGRRSWPKRSPDRIEVQADGNPSVQAEKIETSTGWAMKRWRRSSSQAPLHICSSPGSDTSYVEDQYVNCDANSAVYAELNSIGSFPIDPPSSITPTSNPYSEIQNNLPRPSELTVNSKAFSEKTKCENGGYILSETPPEPNDSSVGSTSTPSSAYYSDISSCDISAPNLRSRSKNKDENRFLNSKSEKSYISSISNQVDFHPVQLNLNSANPQHTYTGESMPMTLQLLPKQLNMDHLRCPESMSVLSENISTQKMLQTFQPSIRYLPPVNRNTLNNLTNNSNPREHSNVNLTESQPTLNSLDPYDSFYLDKRRTQNCNSSNAQRPLPPLPSRRVNGPKRKHLKNSIDPISSLPSKYV